MVLAARLRTDPERRAIVTASLRRYRPIAIGAVPVIAVTGLASSPAVLGQTRELVGSTYGNLLLAKAILVVVAVALGAGALLRPTRSVLVGQAAVALAAILATAAMLTGQPGYSRAPVLGLEPAGTLHLLAEAGGSAVHVGVTVPQPGSQRFQVSVLDPESRTPLTDVGGVALRFRPPRDSGLHERNARLVATDQPGVWATAGAFTPMPGGWSLDVVVRRGGAAEATATFELPIEPASQPTAIPPPDTGVPVPGVVVAAWRLLPTGLGGVGLTIAAIVAAFGLSPWRRDRRGAPLAVDLRATLAGAALVIGLVAGGHAVVEAANQVPPASAAAANPMTATSASVQVGREIFLANCASCHGTDGEGHGPSADFGLPALDETVPGLSDGSLAYRVTVGLVGTRMPGFGTTLSASERWHLVNYLRSAFRAGAD
jgi:mono/diheme cytochrome c family protein